MSRPNSKAPLVPGPTSYRSFASRTAFESLTYRQVPRSCSIATIVTHNRERFHPINESSVNVAGCQLRQLQKKKTIWKKKKKTKTTVKLTKNIWHNDNERVIILRGFRGRKKGRNFWDKKSWTITHGKLKSIWCIDRKEHIKGKNLSHPAKQSGAKLALKKIYTYVVRAFVSPFVRHRGGILGFDFLLLVVSLDRVDVAAKIS